jgi:NitT/TauT family transport system ATP-binding protein
MFFSQMPSSPSSELLAPRGSLPSMQQLARRHIALQNVCKTYGGRAGISVLENISLDINRGEFLSILGPSGCGKSTLLMMIAGLVRPSKGTLEVNGSPVVAPLTDVGIAFQQDLLFDWRTVLGNVMIQADMRGLDRPTSREGALGLLDRAGLKGFEDRHPWELSGGMRQRVALCRALLHGASVILMDEPFGALDALTREHMNLDLQTLWLAERPTAVMVTHSISEAVFLSDRVIVLSPRPARFIYELKIDLPRPRSLATRDSVEFTKFQHRLREAIESPVEHNELR